MVKTVKITKETLETKLEAAKYEAAHARTKSRRAFYIAEVARVATMLAGAI